MVLGNGILWRRLTRVLTSLLQTMGVAAIAYGLNRWSWLFWKVVVEIHPASPKHVLIQDMGDISDPGQRC